MADIAPEVTETVVEKEVENSEPEKVEDSPAKASEKNGNTEEECAKENGVEDKCELKNGSAKRNGLTEKESETNESEEAEKNEVCGIKRKSVGLEAGDAAEVESSEKKQKLEGSTEPDATSNGDLEAKA